MPACRSISAFCFALVLPMAHAAEVAGSEPPRPRKIPAISVLPDGSELEGVVLPRYDEKLRLTGVLHAEKLKLISLDVLQGEKVLVRMIDPDRKEGETRIKLGFAVLDQASNIIRANEEVTIEAARFTATGSTLHLAFEAGRGFVNGPATTVIHAPPKTAMHTPATPRHPRFATAALGMAVATSAVVHARPPAVSDAELAELHRASASRAAELETLTSDARDTVASTLETSNKITGAVRTFLINQVLDPGEDPPATPEPPEAKPLEIEVSPEDTRILSDGGFFFDAEEGILVYLKNVRVTDPRFTLEGVDELKVIFAKKPEKPEDATATAKGDAAPAPAREESTPSFGSGLGEVERIIADGQVLFKQRQPQDGKAPVEASGALFIYDVAKGEIILSGGFPWVRQGGYSARALQAHLSVRIKRDGSFATEGQWEMKGKMDNNNRR